MLRAVRTLEVDLTPQAIIGMPVARIVRNRADVLVEHDDFDTYEGASFVLDDTFAFAVRHYQGHPDNTATLYIDSSVDQPEAIAHFIRKIFHALDLPAAALKWQRSDDPDL